MTLRRTFEASYLGGTELSSGSYSRQSRKESLLDHHMQLDEGTTFTRVSRKMRHEKRSHLSHAMRARLGLQVSREGEIRHVRDSKGLFRSPSCGTYARMTLSTTKIASWSVAHTGSTRLYQPMVGWHALHAVRPPYYQLWAAQGISNVEVHNIRQNKWPVQPYYAL